MLVELSTVRVVTDVPPNATFVTPLKLVPVIVTLVPPALGPDVGLTLVITGAGVGVGDDGGDVNEIVPLLPLYEYVPEQKVVLEHVPDAVPGDVQPVLAPRVADHDPLESTEPLRVVCWAPVLNENWPELSIVNTGPGTAVPTLCSSHVLLVIVVGV